MWHIKNPSLERRPGKVTIRSNYKPISIVFQLCPPQSLCNAWGIRSRKNISILGMNKGSIEEKNGKRSNNSAKIGDSLKQRLMALGREFLTQRSTVERQRKKLGEEEEVVVKRL